MNKRKHIYLTSLIQSLRDNTSLATIDNNALIDKIKDNNLVIYFYPKDNTPDCIITGNSYSAMYLDFKLYDTEIIGISRDNLSSHSSVKLKHKFLFELIADFNGVICDSFYVTKDLNIGAATFMFNKQGRLYSAWRGVVKFQEHVKHVLLTAKEIDIDHSYPRYPKSYKEAMKNRLDVRREYLKKLKY
jgi:peroxiredoxin Q/BCP